MPRWGGLPDSPGDVRQWVWFAMSAGTRTTEPMAEYIRVGAPANQSEREGIRQLRDQLPDHFIVIGNFELQLPRRKNTLEYDAVVIGEWGVYAVEIKGWGGLIEGNMSKWHLEWGRVENPFIRTETKAKALRDLLVRNIDEFPDELFCESVVFLPREDVRLDIDDPRNERLVTRGSAWEFFVAQHVENGPGLLRDDQLREAIRETIGPRAEPGSTAPQVPNYVIDEKIDRADHPYREYIGRHEMLKSRGKVRIKAYTMDPLMPKSERQDKFAQALRDLEALSCLDGNPYVARAYDMFRDDDDELIIYLVSEWVGPTTLTDFIRASDYEGEPTPDQRHERLMFAYHLARAVQMVHREGIVHRNINPEVIYITRDGDSEVDAPLQLADFDYARMSHLQSITGGLSAIGTEGYVAPEMWNGETHDRRVDIFSLGIVFYELFAGQGLFDGISEILEYRTVWERKRQHIAHEPVRELVDEMLVGDPDERLADVGEVVEVLEEMMGDRSTARKRA